MLDSDSQDKSVEGTDADRSPEESARAGSEDTRGSEASPAEHETLSPTAESSDAVTEELLARIRELEDENSELKDQYLRKSADFENFRKRTIREKEDMAAFGNQQLLLDIVPIIDDFERAIRSADESQDFDAFHNGVLLIEKQFTGMLERKWGLRRFDSEGEAFDPQKHEAVATEESADHDEPVVIEDYQKGYMLNDRVLRSAKVKVGMPAPGGPGGE